MCLRHDFFEVLNRFGMALVTKYFDTDLIDVICVRALERGCLVFKFGLHLLVEVAFNAIRTVLLDEIGCSVAALF
jgi:hypothetical protein